MITTDISLAKFCKSYIALADTGQAIATAISLGGHGYSYRHVIGWITGNVISTYTSLAGLQIRLFLPTFHWLDYSSYYSYRHLICWIAGHVIPIDISLDGLQVMLFLPTSHWLDCR